MTCYSTARSWGERRWPGCGAFQSRPAPTTSTPLWRGSIMSGGSSCSRLWRTAIHESRFRQFVREGAVAPAFLLRAYGLRRRRATLIAQMIDLESRLADAAVEMFDKLVGAMFTRAKRRKDGNTRRRRRTSAA